MPQVIWVVIFKYPRKGYKIKFVPCEIVPGRYFIEYMSCPSIGPKRFRMGPNRFELVKIVFGIVKIVLDSSKLFWMFLNQSGYYQKMTFYY